MQIEGSHELRNDSPWRNLMGYPSISNATFQFRCPHSASLWVQGCTLNKIKSWKMMKVDQQELRGEEGSESGQSTVCNVSEGSSKLWALPFSGPTGATQGW